MQTRRAESVESNIIKDNDTWNTCPKCYKDWKDEIATPGLLHRTKLCDKCLTKKEKKNE